MNQTALIVVAIVVVVGVIMVAMLASRARRRRALRDRFGPEYDRALAETGSAGKAESILGERVKRRETLQIRDLDPRARERYSESWRSVQAHFVDDPHGAVREADELVMSVMRARGYPTSDFDQQAGDLSVDYAGVIDNYRKAHEISLAGERSEASTDELRQAMVHYRALFEELLAGQGDRPASPKPEPVPAAYVSDMKPDEKDVPAKVGAANATTGPAGADAHDKPDEPMPKEGKSEVAGSKSEPAPAEPAAADDTATEEGPQAEAPVSEVAPDEAAPDKSEKGGA
jgi:hypothetical protein